MVSPIFDEEWYINEVVGLVFDKFRKNETQNINRIISKEFEEVFERYFPDLDRLLDVKSLPCYNPDDSLYDYLYEKVKSAVKLHIIKINNFIFDDMIYNNIDNAHDKLIYIKTFHQFIS
jgi:hypothetical protein